MSGWWEFCKDAVGTLLFVLAFVVPIAVMFGIGVYLATKAEEVDDPYFRQESCARPQEPDSVEITARGFSAGCVRTREQSYRFVNRLTDFPVTLCLGRRGDCATGHESPFPGGRLTLRPGESVEVEFHVPTHYGVRVPRTYPVTLVPVPELPFAVPDILADSRIPSTA